MRMNTLICGLFLAMHATGAVSGIPRFLRQPSNRTVVIGTNLVTINCHVDTRTIISESNVFWSKDGFAFSFVDGKSPFPRYSLVSDRMGMFNLQIMDVQLEDDARFECQINTKEVQLRSRAAYVSVLVPPTDVVISSASSDVTTTTDDVISVMDGEPVTLRCQATDTKPETLIRWKVGNRDVSGNNHVIREFDSKLMTTKSFISWTPNMADNGTIVSCMTSHIATTKPIVSKAVLFVMYPPDQPTISGRPSGPIVSGSDVTMTCTSKRGNPPATLTWTIDGEKVPAVVSQFRDRSQSTLRHTVRPSNDGQVVTCLATSPALSVALTTNFTFDVNFPPESVEISQRPAEGAFENTTVRLSCVTSQSNPPARLSWLVDGRPIRSQDDSDVITSLSEGRFTRSVLTIARASIDDVTKVFSCDAQIDDIGFRRKVSTRVRMLLPPTSVEVQLLPGERTLKEGDTAQLRCSAEGGNPAPTLSWSRDNRPIGDERGVKILSGACNHDDRTCSVLELKLTSSQNGAKIQCRANHVASSVPQTDDVTLRVLFGPRTSSIVQYPAVPTSGEYMSLTCETSASNPAAKITWYHDDVIISSKIYDDVGERLGENGGFISSSRVRFLPSYEDDKTKITCRASHPALLKPLNRDVILNVEFAPKLASERLRINATEGQDLIFIFIPVHANPANVTFRWSRFVPGGGDFVGGGQQGHFQTAQVQSKGRVSWSQREGELRIRNVRLSDAGVYQVTVANSRGESHANVTIDVFYSARVVEVTGQTEVNVGDDVTMTCKIDSHPLAAASVNWIKKISNPGRFVYDITTSNDVSTLVIRNVTSLDRGNYECIANNGIGNSGSGSFDLDVKFAASINRDRTPTKVARPPPSGPKTVEVTCLASGNPLVTFDWKSPDGELIKAGDEKYLIDYSNLGNDVYSSTLYVTVHVGDVMRSEAFTCVAQNSLGDDVTIINLVPRGIPDPPSGISANNVSHNSATLSWRPGFDGGVRQTFMLQYVRKSSDKITQHLAAGSDTSRWVKVNIPGHKVSYTVRGLLPKSSYLFQMWSTNLYGKSSVSDVISVTTREEAAAISGKDSVLNISSSNLVFIATSCGLFILILGVVFVLFSRKFKENKAAKPHSINTETISLPTPNSSLSGGGGNSPGRGQASFVGSKEDLAHQEPLMRIAQSRGINDVSHHSFSTFVDGTNRYISRDPSVNSLMHEQLSESVAFHKQQIRPSWNVPEHIGTKRFSPRRNPSFSSASEQEFYRDQGYLSNDFSSPQEPIWEVDCNRCSEEIWSRGLRGSETMRHIADRNKIDNQARNYHTLNSGRIFNQRYPSIPSFSPSFSRQNGNREMACPDANYAPLLPLADLTNYEDYAVSVNNELKKCDAGLYVRDLNDDVIEEKMKEIRASVEAANRASLVDNCDVTKQSKIRHNEGNYASVRESWVSSDGSVSDNSSKMKQDDVTKSASSRGSMSSHTSSTHPLITTPSDGSKLFGISNCEVAPQSSLTPPVKFRDEGAENKQLLAGEIEPKKAFFVNVSEGSALFV